MTKILLYYIGMFNTINNLSRKADRYGNQHFVSFLSATLSRLAYMNDNKFLKCYNAIMGPVIHPKILQGINSVSGNNLGDLLDDQKIYGLTRKPGDIFAQYEYYYNGNSFIDYIKLNMPQNINILNGDIKGQVNYPVPGVPTPPDTVKYISLGWSNYGEVYVVADKRMSNTIFVIFRGTYSAKTAALYSKPTSIVPLTVCKDDKGNPEQFLYGIFKVTGELIHTIVEATTYLATNFLGATQPGSVKIFTTGHSLGGAMCTNFAYLWMDISKTAPYNAAPYNVLSENIICISLGAPRCMSSLVAKNFCDYVSKKRILYLRITTRGDPVPGVPLKTGFQHPCSQDSNMRTVISEDCNQTLQMRPTPNVNYAADLDCQNYKTRAYIPNALSHSIYLDILYTKSVDIPKFFKGIGISEEVSRDTDKSTVCRLVMGTDDTYKAIFFNVNKARDKSTNLDVQEEAELSKPGQIDISQTVQAAGFGGEVVEDRRMTNKAFNSLIQQMVLLQGDLSPKKGAIVNPFTNEIMPKLSCPGLKLGGKRRNKTKKHMSRKHKSKRRNKTKRHNKTKRRH